MLALLIALASHGELVWGGNAWTDTDDLPRGELRETSVSLLPALSRVLSREAPKGSGIYLGPCVRRAANQKLRVRGNGQIQLHGDGRCLGCVDSACISLKLASCSDFTAARPQLRFTFDTQTFRLVAVKAGSLPSRCLDVCIDDACKHGERVPVMLYACSGRFNQQWVVDPNASVIRWRYHRWNHCLQVLETRRAVAVDSGAISTAPAIASGAAAVVAPPALFRGAASRDSKVEHILDAAAAHSAMTLEVEERRSAGKVAVQHRVEDARSTMAREYERGDALARFGRRGEQPISVPIDARSTWDDAQESCAALTPRRTLCTSTQVCPAETRGFPYGGVRTVETWAPVADSHNEWLQLFGHKMCKTHSELHQRKPRWGAGRRKGGGGRSEALCCTA